MELQRLLIWVCFSLCLGLTAWGVMIFFRLKERAGLPVVRFLQYYLVMIYAYAYYSLWSDIFIRLFFPAGEAESELIIKVSNLLFLVSMPFLLIGLIMLVVWAFRVIRKKTLVITISAISISAMTLLLILWLIAPEPILEMSSNLAALAAAVVIFVALLLYFSPIDYLNRKNRMVFSTLLIGFGSIHILVVSGLTKNIYILMGFILLYFLFNSALAVVLVYLGEFPDKHTLENDLSLDDFVEKYGITAREQEIILEIYRGKTNREIAETLFVTVQTIKDHTHRIYQKTDVRNRNQLSSMLRNYDRG